MNREINFRAWLEDEKKVVDVELVDFKKRIIFTYTDFWYGGDDCLIEGSGNTLTFEEIELMQYTGLNDKNDVDIYEGDILKITNTSRFCGGVDYTCYSEVKIITGHPHVWPHPIVEGKIKRFGSKMLIGGMSKYIDMRGVATGDVEVVGNIYENPELLEATR